MTTATSRPPRPGEVHGTSSQHRVLCAMFTLFVASHAPSRLTALLPNYSRLVTGVDYFFVGREEFERMIHDDEFVEAWNTLWCMASTRAFPRVRSRNKLHVEVMWVCGSTFKVRPQSAKC